MTIFEDPDPGFKWPVAVARTIAAPAESVWEAISAPGNLERGHPFCAENPVERWPGEGARDAIRWFPHLLRVRPMLQSYLGSVVRGFEWYLTRGEPVPRDQFGPHEWFSAPAQGGLTGSSGGRR